ncbi:hypothetical protein IT396_02740 [Candidatus Nomurabacteria bacterium]|nr:hypothetical protein [Candidatus Nomurabacteria bacterium]
MIKKINKFFDKLEDHIRARLSHHPILYAFIGGVGVVLFWKGVWETAELFPSLFGIPSVLLGLLLMLPTGLFVSFFIGDNIILSGYRREKKMVERTEQELRAEIDSVKNVSLQLAAIEAHVKRLEEATRHASAHLPSESAPK